MLLVTLLGAWQGPLAAQSEDPEPPIAFSISRGTLVAAIRQFSEQTGIQVTADFDPPEVQNYPVNEINESLTPHAALGRILDGSGLTARWHSRRTVRIHRGVVAPHGYGNVNEVLVTGSRIGDGGAGPAPIRVYGRSEIDRLGVSSVPGLAGYFTQQPFSFGEWAQRTGAQHFQMRGLGVDTTLVLINGRRAPPSATSVTLNAFDLNTIPLTAVERIEIMSDSASAIYGADAIGGVVNIIMKEEVESPEFYLHYGDASGGARERRAAMSLGSSGERFKSALTIDYFERGMLVGGERDLWRNQDFRRFGGTDWRVSTANPGNVYSLTGGPLPGLRNPQASVPVGSTGIGLTPQDFLATDGVVSRDSSAVTATIMPELNRLSAFGSAEYSWNERSAIFGEMLLARSDVLGQGALPFLAQQVVPADNPYNPFGEPVAVNYSLVGMKPISYVTDSDLSRFVLGARGGLRRWDWEVVFTSSVERVDSRRVNDVDFMRVQAALASTDPQTALNPFSDGPAGSPALLSSLLGDPEVSDYVSKGSLLSGFLRGELFRLPGGTSEFVWGGEWRREEVEVSELFNSLEQERDVASGFTELKLPVVQGLSVKLALRGDYFERAGDSVNPQYGVVWRPARDWLLRAAYGTSFRPPSLLELTSQQADILFPVADPRRGGAISLVTLTVGGNPDLENVSAHSFTTGFEFRPGDAPGWHAGAQYWRVVMDNRIVVPRTSDIAKLEELGRVTRAAPTEEDIAAGRPGTLQSLDTSLLNYGRLDTSGIDLDVSYRAEVTSGSLEAALATTWVDEYASYDLSAIRSDRVGVASLDGTIPEWRLVGSLSWAARAWGASTTATFTPRYWDSDLSGILNRRLPSRTIIDAQAWLDLGRCFEADWLDGLKLTAGALNLLDEQVDFANVGLSLGFDVSQADLRQRFTYLRVTKNF